MLPTQLLWLCNPVAHAFQVPALCKVRKGRGTHYVFGASEVKSLGHPPDFLPMASKAGDGGGVPWAFPVVFAPASWPSRAHSDSRN